MSKPQWKLDLEAKERAVKEREEAEKQAKAQKLAGLGSASHAEEAPVVQQSQVPDELPELGLVDKEESIGNENKRLQRHMDASNAKAPAKSEEQVKKEEEEAQKKAAEQAKSDEIAAKMQRKMQEYQAQQAAKSKPTLTMTTDEEEYDEEARKRQAAMSIQKFLVKKT